MLPVGLFESASGGVADPLDHLIRAGSQYDDFRLLSDIHQYANGDNRPAWFTEQQHSIHRMESRIVNMAVAMSYNIQETLDNYVIGGGFTYTAKPEGDADAALAATVQDDIDRFVELNEWNEGGLENEIHNRTRIDGEDFVALYKTRQGVQARLVNAEHITEPYGVANAFDMKLGFAAKTCWKYGVHTLAKDVQTPYGYFVRWSEDSNDYQYFPCESREASLKCQSGLMHHIRRNVNRKVKRRDPDPRTGSGDGTSGRRQSTVERGVHLSVFQYGPAAAAHQAGTPGRGAAPVAALGGRRRTALRL